jgi:hypothetical protein
VIVRILLPEKNAHQFRRNRERKNTDNFAQCNFFFKFINAQQNLPSDNYFSPIKNVLIDNFHQKETLNALIIMSAVKQETIWLFSFYKTKKSRKRLFLTVPRFPCTLSSK